jgi:hypothetical protein
MDKVIGLVVTGKGKSFPDRRERSETPTDRSFVRSGRDVANLCVTGDFTEVLGLTH